MAKKIISKEAITKDMAIGDVISKYPETVEIFQEQGLHCVGCAVAAMETIEQASEAHGMNLQILLKVLNEKIKKKK